MTGTESTATIVSTLPPHLPAKPETPSPKRNGGKKGKSSKNGSSLAPTSMKGALSMIVSNKTSSEEGEKSECGKKEEKGKGKKTVDDVSILIPHHSQWRARPSVSSGTLADPIRSPLSFDLSNRRLHGRFREHLRPSRRRPNPSFPRNKFRIANPNPNHQARRNPLNPIPSLRSGPSARRRVSDCLMRSSHVKPRSTRLHRITIRGKT